MLGPEGVARFVTQRLRDAVPPKVVELQTRYGAPARELPAPTLDNIHPTEVDVVAIGRFPSLMVTVRDNVGRAVQTRISESNGQYDEYEYRYRTRVWMYVTGDDYGPTAVQRLRMVLAVREVLLTDRRLGSAGADTAEVDDLSIREVLDEGLGKDDAGKLLGAAMIEFEVKTRERLLIVPGVEVSVTQTVSQLPPLLPHPIDLE